MKTRIVAIFVLFGLGGAGSVIADEYTIEFTGVVDSVGVNLSSAVSAGDDVYGCFTYDTDATDEDPSATYGEYLDSLSNFYIQIGSAISVNSEAGKIRVWDNHDGVYDAFGVIVTALEQPPVPPPEIVVNGRTLKHYQFMLADGPGSATNLDNDDVPTGNALMSAFTNGHGTHHINWMRFSWDDSAANDSLIRWAIGSFASTDANCNVVDPATPAEAINEIRDQIELLGLNAGIERSLVSKLNVALKILDDENDQNDVVAINSLNAFINALNAQSGKKIAVSDAQYFAAAAEAVIASIAGI